MRTMAWLLLLTILLIPGTLPNTKAPESLTDTFKKISLITGVDYHLL